MDRKAHLTFYLLIAGLLCRPEFIINLCSLFKVDDTDLFVICACLPLEASEVVLQAFKSIIHSKKIAIDFVILINIGLFVRLIIPIKLRLYLSIDLN